jgi:hypothetical protein
MRDADSSARPNTADASNFPDGTLDLVSVTFAAKLLGARSVQPAPGLIPGVL